jgi:pilus assembly protein TadC
MYQSLITTFMTGAATIRPGAARVVAPAGGAWALWWLVGFLGVIVVAVAAALTLRVVRRRRQLGEEMSRVFREISMALDDPLLVHQARRRLRQAGGR